MSGPTVEKCKAKVDLAKKLGVSVRRISKGQKIRTKIFHSEQSSYRYTTRKTRSDKLSDDARKTIYDTIFGVPLKYQDRQAIRRT